jgi:hypothetical protein
MELGNGERKSVCLDSKRGWGGTERMGALMGIIRGKGVKGSDNFGASSL